MVLLITQLLVLVLALISEYSCFNLDTNNYIRHEGQNGSMFGFSVALHQESKRSWVIIGAPKADTSQYQQGVIEGGAVYRCDISDDNRCQIIHFDSNGNNYNERNEQIDTKSNQWFGATVSSAGIDGPLVACAPRYVYHQHQPKKVERIEPVGTCFIAKDNFREYQEYSPCRTMYWGYHRQGSCQAGLSAAINKDRLFIGAPGSWYWQGQVYSINTDAVFPYKPPRYGQFGDGGQMYSYSLNNPKDKVYSTKESSSKEDDSYLGYSSITGDFMGDGLQGVAVGMPRGGGLLGKVLVFTWNLTNFVNITGEQIGAYFGYSLCSVDVDGDKLDDLIIGAPMYTEPNNENKYETGRVYIVYQNKFNKFREVETRDGTNSKGRFGLSLTSLGDINLDGYGDFAVGAPYDGPKERGAVYIFHGSKDGPLEKHSQVIYAEDVAGTDHLSTFGFSLSGGIDLDGNQYPDLVVGAYTTNNVIVFKSRAVAVMEASSVFEAENKLISLDNKSCTTIKDQKQVTCTTVTSCLKYKGHNVPASIDIEISWVLDSKKTRTPRMFFLNDEGKNIKNSTMRLYRGKSECRTEAVYIADGIRDKLTPLEVEMKYNMRQATSTYSSSNISRRRRAALEPVLDQNRGTVQRDSINIMKNCGRDNICIPDLRLDVKTVDRYLLGAKEPLIIEVLVSNFGEDAFESNFFMNIPSGLDYKKTEKVGEIRDTSYICTPPSPQTNNTLKCDIGNPLPSGKVVNFRIILDPSKKAGITPFYEFYMEANSTNDEAEGGGFDNVFKKSVSIFVESDISISGNSQPESFHYNITHFKEYSNCTNEGELGPPVVHIYDIRNNGTSTIDEAEIFIFWPMETIDDEPLMYLLNQPEVMGNVHCDLTPYANILGDELKLDAALARKSYLDKNRIAVRNKYAESRTSSQSTSSNGGYNRHSTTLTEDDDSVESAGDTSYVHQNRSKSSSWHSERGSGSSSAQGGGSAASRGSSQRHGTQTGDGTLNEEVSSYDLNTSGRHRGGSSTGVRTSTSYDAQQGQAGMNRGGSGGSRTQQSSTSYESQQGSSGSSSSGGFDASADRTRTGNVDGSNVREYEYQETWNTSSVNGVPVATHHASKNKTISRGQDGRVVITETSTERVISGGIVGGSRWGNQESDYTSRSESRNIGGYREESSSQGSQTQADYERQQHEYRLTEQRRLAEERRISEERRVTDDRRISEERRTAEEKRLQLIADRNKQIEERRYLQEERQRIELERRRQEEDKSRSESSYTESHRTGGSQGGNEMSYESSFSRSSGGRFGSDSGQGSRSSSSSSHSSGTSSGISGGKTQIDFGSNVDQDISSLAARTHAEKSESSSHAGRRRMMSQQDGEPIRHDLATGVEISALEKAAQGGHGFQTVGLDLGVLGARNNVDDEIRHQSASSGNIADGSRGSVSTYESQQTRGGQIGGGQIGGGQIGGGQIGGGRSSSSSSSHGYTYSSNDGHQHNDNSAEQHGNEDGEYEDTYDESYQSNEQNTGNSNSFSRTSAHSFVQKGPLNVQHATLDQRFKHYPSKRDVTNQFNFGNELCESTKCQKVRCVVGPLDKNSGALIALRTRLIAHTLNKLSGEDEVKLSTMAIGRITKLPYIGAPSNETYQTHEVFVTAIPDPIQKPDVVPLWIFVLAACAGALILLLLVYLLYKCGFFKRNRPAGSPHERQPLNRNGNYHGDEHL